MNCMVNAFAKAMRLSPQKLVEALQHNGLDVFEGTNIQRTYHVQEMIDVASKIGIWFSPIELFPKSTTVDYKQVFPIFFGDGTVSANLARFRVYLKNSRGVVLGIRTDVNSGHAMYNYQGTLFDERGSFKLFDPKSDFSPIVYWRVVWTV